MELITYCFGVLIELLMYLWDLQIFPGPLSDPPKLPKWNYDGSNTGQAPGDDSEVTLW